MDSKEHDNVNNPSHYTQGNIECIDAIKAACTPQEYQGFLKGNAIKYIWRDNLKNTKNNHEDLQKAIWYLNRLSTQL